MIDIVIINWNAGNQLRSCSKSIVAFSCGTVATTVVTDNDSTDGSERYFEDLPNVVLIRAGVNLGFAKACNMGVKKTIGEYILFLNPDAALCAGTLPKTLAFMDDPANASVGICGVQLLDQTGKVSRSCARFPTAAGLVINAMV